MKRIRIASALLLCCLLASLVACSAAAEDGALPGSGTTEDETATSVGSAAESQTGDNVLAIGGPHAPCWVVDSLQALDALLANADGYTYYYIFDGVPAGLEVARVGLPVDMNSYNVTLESEKKEPVELFVFTMNEELKDTSGFDEMVVDGVTYYYHQRFDDESSELLPGTGGGSELLVAYFQWVQDGKVFLVHPQEPITPEVIRKYNQMKRVEFNAGEKQVGLDTGIPLISDLDKMKSVIGANSGIQYHTGVVDPAKGSDLLEP